jgi:hypothetical protein
MKNPPSIRVASKILFVKVLGRKDSFHAYPRHFSGNNWDGAEPSKKERHNYQQSKSTILH